MEAYENIIKTEYENKEKLLEFCFEQALTERMTSLADRTAYDLATEQAAFQRRLDRVSAASRLEPEAGLASAELVLRNAEKVIASEHHEELQRVVATQRGAFREHDAIRVEETTLQ